MRYFDMAISKEDRERFERQASDLAKIETDDPGTPERRKAMLAIINHFRVLLGFDPFPDENEEDDPELEFNRRADALGMARIRHE